MFSDLHADQSAALQTAIEKYVNSMGNHMDSSAIWDYLPYLYIANTITLKQHKNAHYSHISSYS